MGGESHGNGTETTRPVPSYDAAEPLRARSADLFRTSNPLSVFTEQDTMKRRIPAGASQNRVLDRSVSARVWRRAECRMNRRRLTPPTHVLVLKIWIFEFILIEFNTGCLMADAAWQIYIYK